MKTLIDEPEVMACGCLVRQRVVRADWLLVAALEIWVCDACRERGIAKHEAAVSMPVAALLPRPEPAWRRAVRVLELWLGGALIGFVLGAALAAGGSS